MRGFRGFLLLLGVSAVVSVHAEIGETRDQLSTRFGHGKEVGDSMLYTADGYSLTVHFQNDKSIMEIYGAPHAGDGSEASLAAADVDKLLQSNAHGSQWKELISPHGRSTWMRMDGRVFARLESDKGILVFLAAN